VDALLKILMDQPGGTPYVIVFVLLLLCGFGLPMPEDIILFAAGLLAYYGAADVYVMIGVCFAGVMLGDSSVFTIGAKFGRKVRKIGIVKRILPPKRMKLVRKKLHEQGNKVIFAARFMPGLRTPIFFSAGTLHLPFRVFFFYDGMAALISVPTIVYAIFYFGDHVDRVIKVIKRLQFGVIGTILVIAAIVIIKTWWAHKKEKEIEE
jgi:membrane protein DedA with SNARE-associated domain